MLDYDPCETCMQRLENIEKSRTNSAEENICAGCRFANGDSVVKSRMKTIGKNLYAAEHDEMFLYDI